MRKVQAKHPGLDQLLLLLFRHHYRINMATMRIFYWSTKFVFEQDSGHIWKMTRALLPLYRRLRGSPPKLVENSLSLKLVDQFLLQVWVEKLEFTGWGSVLLHG